MHIRLKRIIKIAGITILSILLLMVIAVWALSTERCQNYITRKVTVYLEKKLQTHVEIRHVRFAFFNHLNLEGVLINDKQQDTLAYVGTLQLRSSELLSNYWNNTPPIIKNVNITDAYIHLTRNQDSIWNYDFLSESLGSSSSSSTTKDTTKDSPSDLPVSLQNLCFKNTRFFMDDGWRGEDIDVSVAELNLDINAINLTKKQISLKDILIEKANVLVKQYDGNKPEDNSPDDSTSWGTPFNPMHFAVDIQKVDIRHSGFTYVKDEVDSKPGLFDEKNICIRDFRLDLNAVRIQDDTLFAHIDQLQARERSGIAIENMHAKLSLSQKRASLDDLYLQTHYSVVKNHYEMNYNTFHDFHDYINKVYMKGRLRDSKISSLDIGYFANILNEYPIVVDANGDVEGTVKHLKGSRIALSSLRSFFQGDAEVIGLPDIESTFIEVPKFTLSTTGPDVNRLIPQTRTENIAWSELANINFEGNYSGKVDTFYTKGQLHTSLGDALVDLTMNFTQSPYRYAGHIETHKINIGAFVKQPQLGKLSMKGEIDGSGFDLDELNASVKASISAIETPHNTYTNLAIDGVVEQKKFDGIFVSKDPGLVLNFNGKLDLNGKEPVYKLNARFESIDFQKIGFSSEPIIGAGYATLDFSGATLDDFIGKAEVKNLTLQNQQRKIVLDDVMLSSVKNGNLKTIILNSPVADAKLQGTFNLSGLNNAIQVYLSHYLPAYIQLPLEFANQELNYTIQLKDCDSILNTFLPDYHGLSGSYLSGNLNTNTQLFSLDANIPNFTYKQIEWKDISIVGAGDFRELDLNANCGNLLYNGNIIIPSMQMNALMASDTASVSVITQSINDVVGDAKMNIWAAAKNKQLHVKVLPSRFSLKDDNWQLYSADELVFGDKISVHDLIAESGAQQITVNTNESNQEELNIQLKEIDLHGVSAYLGQNDLSLYGRINGLVQVQQYMHDPIIKAELLSNNELRLNNDTLGNLLANIEYYTATEKIKFLSPTRLNRQGEDVSFTGSINLKDSLIDAHVQLHNTRIGFVNQYIDDYVGGLQGKVNGSVSATGSLLQPHIQGDATLSDAAFTVKYLGTRYFIPEAKMIFADHNIQIVDFPLFDQRGEKYTAICKGSIRHDHFSNFYFDLKIGSENLLCLNTQEWDNTLFYGYVPSTLNLGITGYIDDISMDIQAKPLKGAMFHMPISSSGDASTYDYIRFASLGKIQNEEEDERHSNYFKMNMNIEATPEAQVFIILDRNTREEIMAKGNGNINLGFDMGNSMNMFGTYTLTEGKYLFNFRGVLPRTFKIDEGSTIRWNGDPLQAKVDVTAIYKLEKPLPLYPLIAGKTDDPTELSEAKKKYETFVTLFLKNELSNPDITFDITQPSNKAIGTLAYDKLQQIKTNENELVSQAGVLLLLGEFKSAEGLGGSNTERSGVATASDLIGNALSSGLTNVFSDVTGLKNISLNLGYNRTYSMDAQQANINRFNFGLSANLFKDRVIVDFGSNVDIDRNSANKTNSNNLNFGGDLKAQYLVTEDGRLRLNAFSSSSANTEGNNITKGGLGVSYKKVFNSLHDLLSSKRKKHKKKSEQPKAKS